MRINRQKEIWLSLFCLFGLIQLSAQQIGANQVFEWQYHSEKKYENPFREVEITAQLTHLESGRQITIPAFWAGEHTWAFRFSSPVPGIYSFTTNCSDQKNKGLHQRSGEIEVVLYRGDNPLHQHGALQVSKNGTHLEHKDGKPFFWLADSWWHGMTSRFKFPDHFEQLAKDRKAKGFNVIQFAISFPCDIAPFDPRGQNEAGDAWDEAFNSINPAYFDLVDLRIQKLVEMGFIPNIVGLWGYYMKWMGVEQVKKHWAYLLARYGAYPVTYTLSGETTLAYYPDMAEEWEWYKDQFRSQWSEVAKFIQENDPYNRLLTTHPGPGINDGKNPIYEMQYLDMVMLQSGHRGFHTVPVSNRFIQEYRDRFPDKPIIHGEVCFEGMFGSSWQDVQRLLFWSNVLQGTPGYSYGVEGIWQFNTLEHPFGPSPTGHTWGNVPWQKAMHYEGSTQIGYGAKFLQELAWWKLKPAPERVSYHADEEYFDGPYAGEIEDGVLLYFKKLFEKKELKILGLDPQQPYEYIYFDPISGKRFAAKTFSASQDGSWTIDNTPIMQDWVLWVRPK